MKNFLQAFFLLATILGYSQTNKSINDSLISTAIGLGNQAEYLKSVELLDKISPYSTDKNKAQIEKARILYYQQKYDDVIGLMLAIDKDKLDNEELHDYYLILGNVYDDSEKSEKAVELYTEALIKFPESYLLHYNRAVTFSRLKKSEDSYKDLIKSITIYPNFYRSHYLLGLLAINNGNQSEGLLALTTSILLDRSGKITQSAFKTLNYEFSKKHEEPSNTFEVVGHELFESTDNILKKQFALSSNYKLQTDLDIVAIRQIQALLSELPKIKERKGFFAERYLDFYSRIWQEKHFEIFSYRLFRNFDAEAVQKIIAKRDKELAKFNEWLYINLLQTVSKRSVNFSGKDQVVSVIDEDGYIGYGNIENGKKEGFWRYNFANGNKFIEAAIKQGDFSGESIFYYENGIRKRKSNYKEGKLNGISEYYYSNGNLSAIKEFQNDLEVNEQKFYYNQGDLKSRYVVKNGKINGKEEVFYENGKLKSSAEYQNGDSVGTHSEFFSNGTLKNNSKYEKGQLTGDKIEYFPNTFPYTKENYQNGQISGEFTKNYPNGDLYSSYKIENGKLTYYKEMLSNTVTEERFFNVGRLSKQKIYFNNKPLIDYIFAGKDNNEYLTGYIVYDAKGVPSKETKIKLNSPFVVKLANSNIYLEGKYNSKGQKEGEWKYYDAVTGLLDSHSYYSKDVQTNKYEDFFPTGKLKTSYQLSEGKKNGPYVSFYKNGLKSFETNYVNNSQEGEAKQYHNNGKLKTIYFLENDEINGTLERYDPSGELYEKAKYLAGKIEVSEFYNKGKLIGTIDYSKNGPIKYHNRKALEYTETSLKNGKLNGDFVTKTHKGVKVFETKINVGDRYGESFTYNPNNSVAIKTKYENDQIYGEYIKHNLEGKLYFKTNYFNDEEYGLAEKFFHEGFKMSATQNYNDMKNGKEIYYGNNGEELVTLNYVNDILVSYQKTAESEVTAEKGNAKILANYKNGKPAIEINFKNGQLNGDFKFYSDNGNNLISTSYDDNGIAKRQVNYSTGKTYMVENFKDNDYNGITTYYYPNGKIKIEATYSNDELNGSYKEYDPSGKLVVDRKYEDGTLSEEK